MNRQHANGEEKGEGSLQEIRLIALNLLARREHSTLELQHKLNRRGFTSAAIAAVIEALTSESLLSDARFAEVYAHSRADKGYGPLRIRRELQERGVSHDITATVLEQLDDFWPPSLERLHRKRFAGAPPGDNAAQARQIRFLRQRGFTQEQINHLFRGLQ